MTDKIIDIYAISKKIYDITRNNMCKKCPMGTINLGSLVMVVKMVILNDKPNDIFISIELTYNRCAHTHIFDEIWTYKYHVNQLLSKKLHSDISRHFDVYGKDIDENGDNVLEKDCATDIVKDILINLDKCKKDGKDTFELDHDKYGYRVDENNYGLFNVNQNDIENNM